MKEHILHWFIGLLTLSILSIAAYWIGTIAVPSWYGSTSWWFLCFIGFIIEAGIFVILINIAFFVFLILPIFVKDNRTEEQKRHDEFHGSL